jgi:SAM-dependent methyltransferase
MLPIIRGDGSRVEDLTSPDNWKEPGADPRPWSGRDFIDEAHHGAYGRPWIFGRYQFDVIASLGLDPSERVLDLGCGAGRTGVWLIRHLKPRRYFGIEAHLASLVAFAGYECVLHGLEAKQPRFMHDDQFAVEGFGKRFDVVLDLYMSPWLKPEAAKACFARVSARCRPGARLIMAHRPETAVAALDEAGFRLVERRSVSYPMLRRDKPQDDWHVFVKA